jgi:membrane-associated phospholipid phosphatase
MNYLLAGAGTWAAIESGLDWNWRNYSYDRPRLTASGMAALSVGFVMPFAAPVALYSIGRFKSSPSVKLQMTGLALAQSAVLTAGIVSSLKMITSRATPGLRDGGSRHPLRDGSQDFSDEFKWFTWDMFNGWPSGHTAQAFTAAATLAELYPDNLWLRIGAWTYAALIGFGVSTDVHWASDIWAGALIGTAIGRTVGRSFRKLMDGEEPDKVSIVPGFNSISVVVRY